jgi:hypothetical protein
MQNVRIVFTLRLEERRTKGNWIRKAYKTQTGKKVRNDVSEVRKG